MDVMKLGAIGELVGGFAVIATLGYLDVQVRQGTRSSRSATYQAAITNVAEWTRTVGSNNDTAVLLHEGMMDLDSLEREERIHWAFLFTSAVRTFENLFYQYEIGSIDERQ